MAKEEQQTLSYVERYGMAAVTLSEAKEQIMLHIRSGQSRGCPLLVGESGIGKTQIWSAIAEETGMDLQMIHTAHYGLMGAGVPKPRKDSAFFDIALPSVFPSNGKKSIILFDEINRGAKYVINMFFTLMEDQKIFDYHLPPGCVVAATMNPSTGQYSVTELENEVAFRRRMKWFYVTPDFKGWLLHAQTPAFHRNSTSHARGKACHPGVLSYFKAKPKNIYDVKAKDEGKLFCCPASIETVSEDVYNMLNAGIDVTGDFAINRIGSTIGMPMAMELAQHLADSTLTMSAEDVLMNYEKVEAGIAKMVTEGLNEKLTDVAQNVVKALFAIQPKPSIAGNNFAKFLKAIPTDIAGGILHSLNAVAKESKSTDYMKKVLLVLQENDNWIELMQKIDRDYRHIDDAIRNR